MLVVRSALTFSETSGAFDVLVIPKARNVERV